MRSSKKARAEILKVVDNQLRDNTPPETRQNFDRLLKEGITEQDAKIMIAQCVACEIFDILKYKEKFNQERFVANLNKLPEEPFD